MRSINDILTELDEHIKSDNFTIVDMMEYVSNHWEYADLKHKLIMHYICDNVPVGFSNRIIVNIYNWSTEYDNNPETEAFIELIYTDCRRCVAFGYDDPNYQKVFDILQDEYDFDNIDNMIYCYGDDISEIIHAVEHKDVYDKLIPIIQDIINTPK